MLSLHWHPAGSGHRMFLLERKVQAPIGSEGGPVEHFAVLGATGNGTSITSYCHAQFRHCIVRKMIAGQYGGGLDLQDGTRQLPTLCGKRSVPGQSWALPALYLPRLCQGQHLQTLPVRHDSSAQDAPR